MGVLNPLPPPDDQFMQEQMRRRFAPPPPPTLAPVSPASPGPDRAAIAAKYGGQPAASVAPDKAAIAAKFGGKPIATAEPSSPFPFTDEWFNRNIAAEKQAAQDEMNRALGPEASGTGVLSRIGHGAKSLYHEATGTVGQIEQGLTDPVNVTVAATGLFDPALPAAYFGTQAIGGLTGMGQPPPPPGQSSSSVVNAIKTPSPENTNESCCTMAIAERSAWTE